MKSQGLPISTVALILIILITGAIAIMFFYGMMTSGKNATSESTDLSECQQICSKIQTTHPDNAGDAATAAHSFGYCDKGCNTKLSCTIYLSDGRVIKSNVSSNAVCTGSAGWY